MKKFFVQSSWNRIVAIGSMLIMALAVVGCDDSSSASSNDDPGVESSSSEAVFSSSSSEQFFVPSEYRTCDKKYEGKFLLYQYRETLDAWYGTNRVNTVFYKCENGKWSGPSATSPENLTEGDVIRAAPDDWECDAENEGQVQSWSYMMFVVTHSPIGHTPTYYARCEQGDWVLCEPESSSSSSEKSKSSSSKNEESSSSVKLSSSETSVSSSSVAESSSSVEKSSSSIVSPQSSSSATSVSSSSAGEVNCSALLEGETGWNWDVPKECRFNPSIGYGSMTDERDGKVYRTVKIGDQVWMAENLNYYDDSDLSVKEKSWCYGKNDNGDSTTCDVAGRLYTWAAAIDSVKLATDATNPLDCGYGKECGLKDTVQGVCPSGWHLPSKTEWNALFTEVEGKSTAGKLLKSQSGWNKNGNGTDVFGFSALPVGYGKGDGYYYVDGDKTLFWSSTEDGNFDAFCMLLSNTVHRADLAELNYNIKGYGFSVRCVKNN